MHSHELRLHHFLPVSQVNGPGRRAVVWVQGCTLGCPGCFNPETHDAGNGNLARVDDLFTQIAALHGGDKMLRTNLFNGLCRWQLAQAESRSKA